MIVIAGNIGVGKTELTRLLAERLHGQPLFEAVSDNPYLADYYQDMQRWGFHTQVFFLVRRMQHHYAMQKQSGIILQDRSIYEDSEIFARNLYEQGDITPRDWNTYLELYNLLAQSLQPPQLVIYLSATIDTMQQRIAQRGHAYERRIPRAYLEQLQVLYDAWIERFDLCPVLWVDTDQLNYVDNETDLQAVVEAVQRQIDQYV
ncbi:MAG: deoxynucleoside kinase [Chloroflexaceae bacterium]|nr:deoxynucleoside kinase [Chloroflexaceae bacterium]NJO06425.1 deoxynucleoside kinase [Chloroflexaceae bacterium]